MSTQQRTFADTFRERWQDAAQHAVHWYDGMSDPLYVLPQNVIVVYGPSDTAYALRHCAREAAAADLDGDDAVDAAEMIDAFTALNELLEPLLEVVNEAAEDANLIFSGDTAAIRRVAGGRALDWLDEHGIEHGEFIIENIWSRGGRVTIRINP